MIQKYDAIAAVLAERDQGRARGDTEQTLRRLIAEAWHTDEIRHTRPTPQDEARWGFAVVESSLWKALPRFMRELDEARSSCGLPPAALDETGTVIPMSPQRSSGKS